MFYSHDPLAKAAKLAGFDICWLDFAKVPENSELGRQASEYDKNPLGTKGRTSILSCREYRASCGASFPVSREKLLDRKCFVLRSVKGATLPCDACASIPCGLAVRKQHEMLFAASKFEGE